MAQTFKYILTRFCLRSGQLTLPQSMLELFPSSGTVTAVDSEGDREYELSFPGPRLVSGLTAFFEDHQLRVNDEIHFQPLEDGRYSFTAVPRSRKPGVGSESAGSEGITDLLAALCQSGTAMSEAEIRATYPEIPEDFDLAGTLAGDERFTFAEGRWQGVESVRGAVRASEGSPERPRVARVTPYPKGVMFPGDVALNSEQETDELSLQSRLREVLEEFGYSVKALAQGQQFLVQADLGRRQYQAFVHLLLPDEPLDWAALLSRRREAGTRYLTVVGEMKDLERLHAPAGLAHASLWSWAGLERALQLSQMIPLNPLDLEPFLGRDGLLQTGIERLERSVTRKIEERRAFSTLLSRLAALKAPALFLLEDIMDVDLPRDQLLKFLEYLEFAPFHLVSRVDNGEFFLRGPVPDALLQISEYALSLRGHLPSRRGEFLHVVEGGG